MGDDRLPLCLVKQQRRGDDPRSLLKIVRSGKPRASDRLSEIMIEAPLYEVQESS